ncbi:MAG: hypothetical protein ACOX2N_03740 [Peptococcia bacterium]
MMTLVPVLAFGAGEIPSEYTTTIDQDKDSVDIEVDEEEILLIVLNLLLPLKMVTTMLLMQVKLFM